MNTANLLQRLVGGQHCVNTPGIPTAMAPHAVNSEGV